MINFYENDEKYNPNIAQLRRIPFRIPFKCQVKRILDINYFK